MVDFTGLQTEATTQKILLTSRQVNRKIVSGNGLDFLAQIDDLRLKCCIPKENPKTLEKGDVAVKANGEDADGVSILSGEAA